jgi:hypothetical protein
VYAAGLVHNDGHGPDHGHLVDIEILHADNGMTDWDASERLAARVGELRAAGEETDPGILAELARSGRTRRVRSTASERLRVTG